MNTSQLAPYLNFNSNCQEAMEFYQSVLGGELTITTFRELNAPVPSDYEQKVMHSVLKAGSITFFASDCPPGVQAVFGNNMSMSITGHDSDWLKDIFEKLREGGKVKIPLERQVWGDVFGMVLDKFGITWMIDILAEDTDKNGK